MPKSSIDDMLTPRPAARPRICAYAIDDAAHLGQLKVGPTTRKVQQRVAEQLKPPRLRISPSRWTNPLSGTMAPSSLTAMCAPH
jgi:hypothetical protein